MVDREPWFLKTPVGRKIRDDLRYLSAYFDITGQNNGTSEINGTYWLQEAGLKNIAFDYGDCLLA